MSDNLNPLNVVLRGRVVRLCPRVKRTDPNNCDGFENGQTNLFSLPF